MPLIRFALMLVSIVLLSVGNHNNHEIAWLLGILLNSIVFSAANGSFVTHMIDVFTPAKGRQS